MPHAKRKILFIKLCCIGDIVFLTPVTRAVRCAFPDAHLGFLTSLWVKDVVERIPFIDEVIYYDAPLQRNGIIPRIFETLRVLKALREKKYDIALLGHRSSAFSLLALLGGINQRIGFSGTKFLTHVVPFDAEMHETDRYFSLARILQIDQTAIETTLTALGEDITAAQRICQNLSFDPVKRYIGIFPGGGENPGTIMSIKRWYPERYAKLCHLLMEQAGLFPLFLGGLGDAHIVQKIISCFQKPLHFVDTCGIANLGELCGLLQKCAVVIGGDTGPVHMAAALGIPTVMLFGPSDPRLVAPRGTAHRYVWTRAHCSPCYTPISVMEKKNVRGKEFVCWTGTHECMKGMGVEIVLHAVLEVIKELDQKILTTQ